MPGRAPKPSSASRSAGSLSSGPWLRLLGALAVMAFAFIAYWPLTRFYLAQDDFILLERGAHGFRAAMAPFFNLEPGQFRPLTKGLYFFLTWPLFGLDPLPYHVVSIALHALNAILAGAVLRRMGVSMLVSWLGAAVFAAHLCHIEAIAWASCIQQLLGAAFVFAALIFGLDALAGRGRRAALRATIAYALALCSYEQTMAAPFVLVLWQWLRHRRRDVRPLLPMLVVFAVYAVYSMILRGMPDTGPYVMSVGRNVIDNLHDYLGLALSLWHIYPAYALVMSFGSAWLAWIGLVMVHVAFRTYRELAFGLLAFFAFLAPVLFTTAHTHSFHLYVPEIALVFLLASAGDSLRRFAGEKRRRMAALALAGATLVVVVGSVAAVRTNVKAVIDPAVPLPRIFVLRRAVIAEQMCKDVFTRFDPALTRMIMLYPGDPAHKANWRNAQSAAGGGSAFRLLVNRLDLGVVFVPPDTLPADAGDREVRIFTEAGYVMTVREWNEVQERRRQGERP